MRVGTIVLQVKDTVMKWVGVHNMDTVLPFGAKYFKTSLDLPCYSQYDPISHLYPIVLSLLYKNFPLHMSQNSDLAKFSPSHLQLQHIV